MVDYVKISELPAASSASGSDQLEANQAGTSRRVTVDQLLAALAGTTVEADWFSAAGVNAGTDHQLTTNPTDKKNWQWVPQGTSGDLVLGAATDAWTNTATWTFGRNGTLTVLSGTAVGAGANTQAFVKASSTANLGIYYGTGDPTFSAAKGSLYSRTDATSTTTRLWVNTNGSTTWTNLTTAA